MFTSMAIGLRLLTVCDAADAGSPRGHDMAGLQEMCCDQCLLHCYSHHDKIK